MPILFYGDPHGEFGPLIEAAREHRPEHVVLMGDLELERPFREEMAPLIAAGIRCWWILGNHDADTGERFDFLVGDHPEGDIGGRVVEMACRDGTLAVAGLGGVYKGRIWYPRDGAEPRFRGREEFLRQVPKTARWRGGLPLRQRDTIFPEDHERLAALRCDLLVTHEAPSCHELGNAVIDDLGRAMRARLIVHGHMHRSYRGATRDGIPVRGLAGAEAFLLSPSDPAPSDPAPSDPA